MSSFNSFFSIKIALLNEKNIVKQNDLIAKETNSLLAQSRKLVSIDN